MTYVQRNVLLEPILDLGDPFGLGLRGSCSPKYFFVPRMLGEDCFGH